MDRQLATIIFMFSLFYAPFSPGLHVIVEISLDLALSMVGWQVYILPIYHHKAFLMNFYTLLVYQSSTSSGVP